MSVAQPAYAPEIENPGGPPPTVVARVPGPASFGTARSEDALDSRDLPAGPCRVGPSHPDSEALRADPVGVALRIVPPGSRESSRRVVEVELVADSERRSGLDLVMPVR